MHVHPMSQPMQHFAVEHQPTQAARQAEAKRRISQFMVEGDREETAKGRSDGRQDPRERARRDEEPEDGEFAHVFSIMV